MTLVSQTDISPVCNSNSSFTHISCYPMPSFANTGAIEEWHYTSDLVYPNGVTLNGVPPAQGWIFSHTNCCRNPCTNILNADGEGWYLRAVLYPHNDQTSNTCYDNSPVFAEKPVTVVCSGLPFSINYNALDKDGDSLSYSWAPPLNDLNSPLSFATGYTYNSPLPGPAQNPNNVAPVLDPYSGQASFTSFTQGAFVTVMKVTSYRDGTKISEIFNEIQIVILGCTTNNVPDIIFNNLDSLWMFNHWIYNDTVHAQDTVMFSLFLNNNELLPDGSPQTITLNASGNELGYMTSAADSGCLFPPCATLNPSLPMSSSNNIITLFVWETDCSQLNNSMFEDYYFYFNSSDDFCPIPGSKNDVVKIVLVSDKEVLPPPKLICSNVQLNGDVLLQWLPPPDITGVFNSYYIYYSISPEGPFTVLDSVFDIDQTSFTHLFAGANAHANYYNLKTRSGCNGIIYSNSSQTISTMFLQTSGYSNSTVHLSWNPISDPLPSSASGIYRIYRKSYSTPWVFIGSTLDTTFDDNSAADSSIYLYRVEIEDTSGCISSSEIAPINTDISTPSKEDFNFYINPNPFKEDLTLVISSDINTEVCIKILDCLGKSVWCNNYHIQNGKNEIPLDLKLIKEGLYFLQIKSENMFCSSKLVKY
jgi:hypothetical protein